MKKYLPRITFLVLAFFIGTALFCFSACEKIEDSTNPQPKHSIENGSPYSVIDKNTIIIKPFDASFEIPENWLEYDREKNIFLNCSELNHVETEYGGGFDDEDNQILNAAIPFKDCGAHFGDKGWDNHLWNDLQGRVYITTLSEGEIAKRIEINGLEKASKVFEEASVKTSENNGWQHKKLAVLDAPTHFMLFKEICFYYRSFDNKTVIFAFLHADSYEEEINSILSSFNWQRNRKETLKKKLQIK